MTPNSSSVSTNGTSKRRRAASRPEWLAALACRVQAVIVLAPLACDVEAVRILLQAPEPLRTLEQVAIVFGRSTNTVQRSWRSNAMPGEAGNYDAAEILVWLLDREHNNRQRRAEVGHDPEAVRELSRIELDQARTTLALQQTKLCKLQRDYVPLIAVQATFRQILNVLRDTLCGIPRTIEPMLPARHAKELSAEVGWAIRNALTAAAETPIDDIVERVESENRATDENGR